MKQLMQSVRTGEVEVLDVPAPGVERGRVLVRAGASLISAGTERMVVEFASKNLLEKAKARPDLVRQVVDKAKREGVLTAVDAVRSRLDAPMPMGYSSAGTVIAVGEGGGAFHAGDRVACAGGGHAVHAEIISVPKNLCVLLPEVAGDELTFDEAAFTTVGAIAMQGVRLGEPALGEVLVVIGLGLIGLMAVQIARAAGCRVIGMDLSAERCKLAESMGCEATATSNDALAALTEERTAGIGADVIVVAAATSSNDPVTVAGRIARERGRVIAVGAVGLDIPRKDYYEKELDLRVSRSYGPGRYDEEYEEKGHDYPAGYVRWTENRNMGSFAHLLATRAADVRPLITHRFPIEQAAAAYRLISQTEEPFLGVVLTYPADSPAARRVEVSASSASQRVGTHGVVGVGLIGAGNFATNVLLPAMKDAEHTRLTGVCTASGASARHVADRFGFSFATTDEAELLADPSVTAVVIATRHHLHAAQVIAALRAGKHVHCEKPLCLNREELDAVVAAAEAHPEQILTVGFNRRFSPMGQRLRSFARRAGEPLVMQYRANAGPIPLNHWVHDPEQGGGRIIGEACHFIDFLISLTGAPPVRVDARATPDGGRYREDNAVITLEFADGSVGTVVYAAGGDRSFSKERVEVFGGGLAAVLDDFRSLELIRDGKRTEERARLRQDKGHRAGWEALVTAIRTGGPAPVPLADSVAATLATFAAMDALRTGRPQTMGGQPTTQGEP